MKKLAILGEFNPASETHAATNAAIGHSKQIAGNRFGRQLDLDRGHFRRFTEAFSWIFGSAGQSLQEYGKGP